MAHTEYIYNISSNINYLMRRDGIKNVKQLAETLGVPPTTIYNITSRKNKNPSIETVQKIATFFSVSMDEFVNSNFDISTPYKKVICPFYTLNEIKFNSTNPKGYKFFNGKASKKAIAVKLTKDIKIYKRNDILFFDTIPDDQINYPTFFLVEIAGDIDILYLHKIDGILCSLEKRSLIHNQGKITPLEDIYKSEVKILYTLIGVEISNSDIC